MVLPAQPNLVAFFTGVYLEDFFNDSAGPDGDLAGDTLVSTNLTDAQGNTGVFDDLFNLPGNFGLNVFSFDGGTAEFVAGSLAFSGTATWDLTADSYARMLAGNSDGAIFVPADTDDDIPNATQIGFWERTDGGVAPVPLPAAGWMLGAALMGFGAVSRRKTKS